MRWSDQRLRWDRTKYGDEIYFPISGNTAIWTPDICAIQSNSKLMMPEMDTPYARARYDGFIYISRPGIINTAHEF